MAKSTTISVRISDATKQRLARLAESTKRSQAFLAAEAIEEFVDLNQWQVDGIEQGLAALDRGDGVAHERVKEWAEALGTKRRKSLPKSG